MIHLVGEAYAALGLLEKILRNLGSEASKILMPAPEGYKYEVRIVPAKPDAAPAAQAPVPSPIPYDPTKKYEHKGLSCDVHAQQAHRREREGSGPWTCVVCSPQPPDPESESDL